MVSPSPHKNLLLLCWLRWVAIAAQLVTILAVTQALGVVLDTGPLYSIVAAVGLANLATLWRVRQPRAISPLEFFLQLTVDMTALFGLLYFTGGAANPFASLFILQVVIAAITLTAFYTWLAAGLSMFFYTALLFFYVELPYFQHHTMSNSFDLHVVGMWVSFLMLAGMISWFVVRMNGTIRRQNRLLAEAEKMAALGALAAHSAHELGTPLATLYLLAEKIDEPRIHEQLMRCKRILGRITAAAGVTRAEGSAPMPLEQFLRTVIDQWRRDQPDVELTSDLTGEAAPRIMPEYGLEQAIRNLLSNAAAVSPHKVCFTARWDTQTLEIAIRDEGPGIETSLLDSLGEIGVSTKPDGLGLGLFLAQSVIRRLEGTLTLANDPKGGIVARIVLPLRRLAL